VADSSYTHVLTQIAKLRILEEHTSISDGTMSAENIVLKDMKDVMEPKLTITGGATLEAWTLAGGPSGQVWQVLWEKPAAAEYPITGELTFKYQSPAGGMTTAAPRNVHISDPAQPGKDVFSEAVPAAAGGGGCCVVM
jgi:hypothetical protein